MYTEKPACDAYLVCRLRSMVQTTLVAVAAAEAVAVAVVVAVVVVRKTKVGS